MMQPMQELFRSLLQLTTLSFQPSGGLPTFFLYFDAFPKEIILKMDIEGYECKALKPEILNNEVDKFIPLFQKRSYKDFYNHFLEQLSEVRDDSNIT